MNYHRIMLLVVLIGSLTYFLALTAPDATWINADVDGYNYVASAKYLTLSHPTGAPLYNLLNWMLIRLPFGGSEFWRLAIWSAIASAGTSVLLYHLTKRLIAPMVFMASGLVVSQSTILDAYALITFVMVLAYYLHITNKPILKYALLGFGLAIHHLAIFALLPLFVHDVQQGRNMRLALFTLIGVPFYLYVPLFNRPPYEWIEGESFAAYWTYFQGQGWLIGGLAIMPADDLIERSKDFAILTVVGFGAMLPLLVGSINRRNILLLSLAGLPAIYYFTMLPDVAYVYYMPSFAFGAILIAQSIDKLPVVQLVRAWQTGTLAFATAMIFYNVQTYDIGRTLDPKLSASNFYRQLDSIPDDAVVFTDHRGWEKAAIWLYARNTGRDIRAIYSNANPQEIEARDRNLNRALTSGNLYRTEIADPYNYESHIVQWRPESFAAVEWEYTH